jgi:hypothetical protein
LAWSPIWHPKLAPNSLKLTKILKIRLAERPKRPKTAVLGDQIGLQTNKNMREQLLIR